MGRIILFISTVFIFSLKGTNAQEQTLVPGCYGQNLQAEISGISTDQEQFNIDASACANDQDLLAYLNCIAENNTIDDQSSFILELEAPQNNINGVSTLDMVIIQRHILGIQPLPNTSAMLAADVTLDSVVSAFDLLILRRSILGIDNSFPVAKDWMFYRESQNAQLSNELYFTKSEFPLETLDIKAVKLGDVNGTANYGN